MLKTLLKYEFIQITINDIFIFYIGYIGVKVNHIIQYI